MATLIADGPGVWLVNWFDELDPESIPGGQRLEHEWDPLILITQRTADLLGSTLECGSWLATSPALSLSDRNPFRR